MLVWAFKVPPGSQLGVAFFFAHCFCVYAVISHLSAIYTYMLNALFIMYFSVIDLFSLLNNTIMHFFLYSQMLMLNFTSLLLFYFSVIILLHCIICNSLLVCS